jgi:hypothetical protein
VPESIATWLLPRGHVPETSCIGLNRVSSGSTLNPRFGAPPDPITLPFRPTSFVWSSVTAPAAACTSGSACTFRSNVCGRVGAWTPFPFVFSNAVLPVMMTSAFLYDCEKIELNAPLIVSVRTNVPLAMATPSTIAVAVSAARSLRPRSPFSATFSTWRA